VHALIALFAVNVSQAGARTDNRLCTGALIAAFRRAALARVAARSPIGGASWWETRADSRIDERARVLVAFAAGVAMFDPYPGNERRKRSRSSLCSRRPAASEHGDRLGRNPKKNAGTQTGPRMLCGWGCRARYYWRFGSGSPSRVRFLRLRLRARTDLIRFF
jgi:hypothetical protein